MGDSNNIDIGGEDRRSNEQSNIQCMPFMMTIPRVPISNLTKFSLDLELHCMVEYPKSYVNAYLQSGTHCNLEIDVCYATQPCERRRGVASRQLTDEILCVRGLLQMKNESSALVDSIK